MMRQENRSPSSWSPLAIRFILILRKIIQTSLIIYYKGFEATVQVICYFDLTRYILLDALGKPFSLA